MKKLVKNLPQVEWDFEQVQPNILPMATLYEYARTSDKIRSFIVSELDFVIDGKAVRSHLYDAAKRTPNKGKLHDYVKSQSATTHILERMLLHRGDAFSLVYFIYSYRPDFPQPWIKAPVKSNPNPRYSRISCEPLQQAVNHLKRVVDLVSRDNLVLCRDDEYILRIKFSDGINRFTSKEIVSDFARWLSKEIVKHPEAKKKGKPSQAPFDKLRGLAALRLHNAGFTFESAIKLLNQEPGEKFTRPIYADKSGWSDAIARARRELDRLEVGF